MVRTNKYTAALQRHRAYLVRTPKVTPMRITAEAGDSLSFTPKWSLFSLDFSLCALVSFQCCVLTCLKYDWMN